MYYIIYFPYKIDATLIYQSNDKILPGCRVAVYLGSKLITGLVWSTMDECNLRNDIKYREINYIIDTEPIINKNSLRLAEWISKYYHENLGVTLFSMIPKALDINLVTKLRKIKSIPIKNSDGLPELILNKLKTTEWTDFTELSNMTGNKKLILWLEEMEKLGVIEFHYGFDNKIKKKIVNKIILLNDDTDNLSEKQIEIVKYLNASNRNMLLADLAKEFSYSTVKALRIKQKISIMKVEKEEESIIKFTRENVVISLNSEQEDAFNVVKASILEEEFKAFLLYGITGSGKTEVYIEAIKECLKIGKRAILLLPEISLTPQMMNRFYNRFEEGISILHSKLNDRERLREWRRIKDKSAKIVIGARSAIFAPIEDLGLIIVDEEHEGTYKQDQSPRYNARDVAIMRAVLHDAVVILGSATPSLESLNNCTNGKYEMLKLTKRPGDSILPDVKIIDMKKEKKVALFSEVLIEKINERLSKKEQIIIFQNRRGYASFLQCIQCSKIFKCVNCNISMNYHTSDRSLHCHYCGYKMTIPRKCPDCSGYLFNYGVAGTQQVESQLNTLFPTARVCRMDADTTGNKDAYESMFQKMRNGHIDILIGTQMITKGLDFPNVTLVGIISADMTINLPDFRAAEKAFQLFTQVAGRAGRSVKKGEVIIQTYNPQHYVIDHSISQDIFSFSVEENKYRKMLKYPPFSKIARVIVSHKDEKYIAELVQEKQQELDILKESNDKVMVMGYCIAPIEKINNRTRYHLIIKAEKSKYISAFLDELTAKISFPNTVKVVIDIDPMTLL